MERDVVRRRPLTIISLDMTVDNVFKLVDLFKEWSSVNRHDARGQGCCSVIASMYKVRKHYQQLVETVETSKEESGGAPVDGVGCPGSADASTCCTQEHGCKSYTKKDYCISPK